MPGPLRVRHAFPTFLVRDMERAISFYTTKLGGALAFRNRGPPEYAGIDLGGVEIRLEEQREAGGGAAFFVADDVDALFAAHQAAGIVGGAALVDQAWGMRDYAIRDPDGNRLAFGTPIARPVPATKGVHAELLAMVDLGREIEGMEGRALRMRKFTFEPGAVFGPLHDHKGRPGTVFILEGKITDHRDGVARDYGPGLGWPEDRDTLHWLENRGRVPAVEISVDIVKRD